MRIEYFHASKFGNGAMVAEEFTRQMAARGVPVNVHHIREVRPDRLPPTDLYLFSSPGRMGKPIGGMRRFLKKLRLPAGTSYAILTTEMAPQPDKKTGRIPTEAEAAKWQRVRPIMNEILQAAGLVKVAEDKVFVTGLKGPLEDGWQRNVAAFATRIPFCKRRLMEAIRTRLHRARQAPYASGRAVTGPDSPDPVSDLKQRDAASTDADTGRELVVVLAMGWCTRAIDAIRQRGTPVVPRERGVTAQQTNWRHGMANKDTGYGRNWKKWLAIYAVAGVVVYLIVYLVFFSGGGGGAAGGGGLY